MTRLSVAPIVEGHGEYSAIRGLLQRVWIELVGGEYLAVLQPIRRPRTQLVNDSEGLAKAVNLAALKLDELGTDDPCLILILLDADEDAACLLAPDLLQRARAARSDRTIRCVLANREYETWFVAAAESLAEHLTLTPNEEIPPDPECTGQGKKWIEGRFRGPKYSETIDQPRLTAAFDLHLCRRRSPSFDKLCRELEAELRPPP